VKDTRCDNYHYEFCSVLLEIKEEAIKKHYGADFLLQGWSSTRKKVFEKPLQSTKCFITSIEPLSAWAQVDDSLIFQDDEGKFEIVDLKNPSEL